MYTFYPLQMPHNRARPLKSAPDLAQCPRTPHKTPPPSTITFIKGLAWFADYAENVIWKGRPRERNEKEKKNVEKSAKCEATKNGGAEAAVSSSKSDKRTGVLLISRVAQQVKGTQHEMKKGWK